MSKYVFQPGDRAKAILSLPAEYAGRICTIVQGLGYHEVAGRGRRLGYKVQFDHLPHANYAATNEIELVPPTRGDMDTKVGWDTRPTAVVNAMKGE